MEEVEHALAEHRAREAQEAHESRALAHTRRGVLTPYLGGTAVAAAGGAALVLFTALPAAGVALYGGTFLGVAMVMRALEDLPSDSESGVVRWLADRADIMSEKFGVEFYGIASLTAFVQAEITTFGGLGFPIGEMVANPIGFGIQWFVEGLIQSIMNAVWSALWWLQLMAVDGVGLGLMAMVILVGWTVWRVLDTRPSGVDSQEGFLEG